MRRFLFLLIAWWGIAAPAWSAGDELAGVWATRASRIAACNSHAGSDEYCSLNMTNINGAPAGNFCGVANAEAGFVAIGGGDNRYYCNPVSQTCPAGQVAGAGGQCVAACQYDAAIPASSPSCVAPQTCTAHAGVDAFYQVGGGTSGAFCQDGCQYTMSLIVDATPGADESCFSFTDAPSVIYCMYSESFNGQTCTGSASPSGALPAGTQPTAGNTNEAPTCPTGYTLNSFNQCVSAGTAGTASTSTSPGTAGTPGDTTCPIGYQEDGNGQCVATANQNIGCPVGYALDSAGQCRASTPTGQSGGEAEAQAGAVAAAATLGKGEITAAGNAIQGGIEGVSGAAVNHGWTWGWSSLSLPTASCAPWTITTGGRTLTIDACPVAEKIREIGAYVLYVMTVIMLFNILTGHKPE